jgi:hypothetical protein
MQKKHNIFWMHLSKVKDKLESGEFGHEEKAQYILDEFKK